MISRIRNSFLTKALVVFTVLSIVSNIVFPSVAYALTGGPQQPSVQGFEPAGVTNMVDVFSGDFKYNIPLFSIGGYPINLNYNASVSTDMEASWVGLGWSLNPGSINRNKRGLPDEFCGDEIVKTQTSKDMINCSMSGGIDAELGGIPLSDAGRDMTISYNNYTGIGFDVGASLGMTAGFFNFGAQMSSGTNGMNLNPYVSLAIKEDDIKHKMSISSSFNSRQGLKALNYGYSEDLFNTNFGSQVSFATPSYMPQIHNPKLNFGVSLDVKFGVEIVGTHPAASLGVSYSHQWNAEDTRTINAFGYMYSAEADMSNSHHMMDINREKDGKMVRELPNLPLGFQTYDVYSVNTEIGGGAYRPKLNSIGVISDPYIEDGSNNDVSLGAEIGVGNAAHSGVNPSHVGVHSSSGQWNSTAINSNLEFSQKYNDNSLPFTFVKSGSLFKAQIPDMFETNLYDPVAFGVNSVYSLSGFSGNNSLTEKYEQVETLDYIQVENRNACVEPKIQFYDEGFSIGEGFNPETDLGEQDDFYFLKPLGNGISRDAYSTNDHHFTEMRYTNTQGQMSVFGLPVYNRVEKAVSFSTDNNNYSSNMEDGLCEIGSEENSTSNQSGNEKYYSEDITPEYATTYLLTSVLSPDYQDSDNIIGPSDGDNGAYVKFDYSIINDYKWRAPYHKANYNPGLIGKNNDDKGSYIYGEKDVCHLKAIESKEKIAIFYISEREDSKSANSESQNSGVGNESLRKLDSIQVFSKQALIEAELNVTPIPEKTVVFEYDYSLCPNVPNNESVAESGKLTLKKVYFKYGGNGQGKLSPYSFEYNNTYLGLGENSVADFEYNSKNYDRWGNFSEYIVEGTPTSPILYSSEYPYTNQEVAISGNEFDFEADRYARAWLLSEITLPTQAKISIEYEADDYAFVQNKRAMQMVKVVGSHRGSDISDYLDDFDPDNSNNEMSDLYSNFSGQDPAYLIVHIPAGMLEYLGDAETLRRYLLSDINGNIMEFMYYKFDMELEFGRRDFVEGYVEIDQNISSHVFNASGNLFAIKVNLIARQDALFENTSLLNTHPITQNAINYCRKYYPEVAYNTPDIETGNLMQIVDALQSVGNSISQSLLGVSTSMIMEGKCKRFDNRRSWVRLYNPICQKKGGGTRVKQISMTDSWSLMTNNAEADGATYGQRYDYTTEHEVLGRISSGVASYEPAIGNEENPFRMPVSYSVKSFLTADEHNYVEEPFGETFFPSPQVGYSEVTIKPLSYEDDNYSKTRPGYSVQEFYTAKDFPVVTKHTTKDFVELDQPSMSNGFVTMETQKLSESQGYLVIKNDMHGKMKKSSELDAYGQVVSYTEHLYKTTTDGKLSSNLPVVDEFNTISEISNAGVIADVYVDMREHQTHMNSEALNCNFDVFALGVFPGILISALPHLRFSENEYRSAVITKVVEQTGILEKVVTYEEGAEIAQENLLWDKNTGGVLLTSTINEFEDDYYSFNFPAYWSVEKMRQSYKRLNSEYEVDITEGTFSGINSDFKPGDQVLVKTAEPFLAWVAVEDNSNVLIDVTGVKLANYPDVSVLLIKPSETNQLALSSGTVLCKKNPAISNNLYFTNSDVIQSSAVEYRDETNMNCNCAIHSGEPYNPYLEGEIGIFKPYRNYYLLASREQRNHPDLSSELHDDYYNTHVRADGVLSSYMDFWTYNATNQIWQKNQSSDFEKYWRIGSEISLYSPDGKELENKNALNIFSSVVYGYNSQKAIMKAENAAHRNIGFDGFEDYSMNACDKFHFSFKEAESGIGPTTEKAHTGKYSIRLMPGESVNLEKDID